MATVAEVFGQAMSSNRWGSDESVSGPGSTLKATQLIRDELPLILGQLGIRRFVDAACGDCGWISQLGYQFDLYIGCDVVPRLVSSLRRTSSSDTRRFQVANVATDLLPRGDAVLCRDCLVHLPFAMAERALQNFTFAGFEYAFLTTFPGRTNTDIPVGRWRPLDMQAPPFNLPQPLYLIRERPVNPEDQYNDKMLGVWRVSDWQMGPVLPPLPEPPIVSQPHILRRVKDRLPQATTVEDIKELMGHLIDVIDAH